MSVAQEQVLAMGIRETAHLQGFIAAVSNADLLLLVNKDDNTHEFQHNNISTLASMRHDRSVPDQAYNARRAASFECPMVGGSLPQVQRLLAS